MNVADKNRLVELASRPGEFISRLKIVDEKGQERLFNHPFAEQVAALEDFQSDAQTVIHYKPRQIGDTTVATAYNFNYLYWATDPARCLVVADSYDSTDAIFRSCKALLQKPSSDAEEAY